MRNAVKSASRPIVVFGFNAIEKTVAGTFAESDANAAALLAKQLKLRQVTLTRPDGLALIPKLPAGIPGAKRIPLVSPDLYSALLHASDREATSPKRAASWDKIAAGSLVLAHESIKDGWWEAVVLEVKNDTLTLGWRDFPRQANVTRNRGEVALLHPTTA